MQSAYTPSTAHSSTTRPPFDADEFDLVELRLPPVDDQMPLQVGADLVVFRNDGEDLDADLCVSRMITLEADDEFVNSTASDATS